MIGLLTDKDGDPLSIEVFKGNTNDYKTVVNQSEKIEKNLEARIACMEKKIEEKKKDR